MNTILTSIWSGLKADLIRHKKGQGVIAQNRLQETTEFEYTVYVEDKYYTSFNEDNLSQAKNEFHKLYREEISYDILRK
tara:strand:- start:1052 stop:1288 length:237 start_codon:yes stop_codon:yes gene_type:complete